MHDLRDVKTLEPFLCFRGSSHNVSTQVKQLLEKKDTAQVGCRMGRANACTRYGTSIVKRERGFGLVLLGVSELTTVFRYSMDPLQS